MRDDSPPIYNRARSETSPPFHGLTQRAAAGIPEQESLITDGHGWSQNLRRWVTSANEQLKQSVLSQPSSPLKRSTSADISVCVHVFMLTVHTVRPHLESASNSRLHARGPAGGQACLCV